MTPSSQSCERLWRGATLPSQMAEWLGFPGGLQKTRYTLACNGWLVVHMNILPVRTGLLWFLTRRPCRNVSGITCILLRANILCRQFLLTLKAHFLPCVHGSTRTSFILQSISGAIARPCSQPNQEQASISCISEGKQVNASAENIPFCCCMAGHSALCYAYHVLYTLDSRLSGKRPGHFVALSAHRTRPNSHVLHINDLAETHVSKVADVLKVWVQFQPALGLKWLCPEYEI